jgi:hypothetical protein
VEGVIVDQSKPPAGGAVRPLKVRVFALVVVVLLGFHFFMTYAWNTSSAALQSLAGGSILTSYMTPMFTQGWAVFAPNPGSTNTTLQVRALRGSSEEPTAWFDVSQRDTERFIRYHVAPSRMYLNNYILADRFHGSVLALDSRSQHVVETDYRGRDGLQKLKFALRSHTDAATPAYLEYDQTVIGLATAIATARWGEQVSAVQVRIGSTAAVPFENRFDSKATPRTSYFTEGWRAPVTVPHLDTGPVDDFYGRESTR